MKDTGSIKTIQKETKHLGSKAVTSAEPDIEQKIKEYLVFHNFLKRNSSGSTDLTLLRTMIRKYSDILSVCKNLRTKVLKRLFSKAHTFDAGIASFLNKHSELLKNEAIMSKQDSTQIRKDIERISLHPILKSTEVRAHLTSIL